jgi:hypothetical protein
MLEAAIGRERMLTGPEKAAALLLMMGKPPAARLLKQFDQPDLQAVARAAAGLGAISATTLDRLVEEFAADFSAAADLFSDAGQVKNLLADSMPPEQIADILGTESEETLEIDTWRALARAPESAIIALLMAERATTATYILSKLDAAVATKAIAALPAQRRSLRAGRAPRRDAARRAAHRRGGGERLETRAKGGRRCGRTVAPRRHNQRSRSGRGGGRHAGARTGPTERRGRCENHALLFQRSAATLRARSGVVVRPRLN